MEGVLTSANVRDRLAKLCVGLAADCDHGEPGVESLMSANLKDAQMLPFVAFVTPEGKWVAGWSGYKDEAAFLTVLTQVEKSPLLDAAPDVAKKLEGWAAQATQAAEKSDWTKVLAAAKAAGATTGRSPHRAPIADALGKARAWADGEMTKILDAVAGGGDRAAGRSALQKLAKTFAGEPEAKEAEAGVKALERFGLVKDLAADKADAAKTKALADFAGTRWTKLFGGGEAKPAAPEPQK